MTTHGIWRADEVEVVADHEVGPRAKLAGWAWVGPTSGGASRTGEVSDERPKHLAT